MRVSLQTSNTFMSHGLRTVYPLSQKTRFLAMHIRRGGRLNLPMALAFYMVHLPYIAAKKNSRWEG